MSTLRQLGKYWHPLAGIWFIVIGIGLVFKLDTPPLLEGIWMIVIGILALFAS